MAQIGGEVAVKRPNLSSFGPDAGEDRLSALPDDILVLILLRLETISNAARTSVLSPRWRRIWTLLPELTCNLAPDYHHIGEVLAVPEAPALRRILVVTKDDAPESLAAWLPLAARRLSGDLVYHNMVEGHEDDEEEVDGGAIPLPCFGNATRIDLDLGFLALWLPSSGAFTGLTELCLKSVRFQGPCVLGDVVSSPRCPCLRKLSVRRTWGLDRLAVQSQSLLQIYLQFLNGLQQLSIDASALKKLKLLYCFARNQPVADISAPQLVSLQWSDSYDPSTVHLVSLGQLRCLRTYFILGYHRYDIHNRGILQLLHRFQFISNLHIWLCYRKKIRNFQYLMEGRKTLPNVALLTISVLNGSHSFGACSFDILRLCAGIRRLSLFLQTSGNLETQLTCPTGCICEQPTKWKSEELSLNGLQEVEITGLRGAEHEVVLLKLLFNWAIVLEKMRVTFDYSISKSKAKELCQKLTSFSKPETCVQFYMYQHCDRRSVDLVPLEDESTGM